MLHINLPAAHQNTRPSAPARCETSTHHHSKASPSYSERSRRASRGHAVAINCSAPRSEGSNVRNQISFKHTIHNSLRRNNVQIFFTNQPEWQKCGRLKYNNKNPSQRMKTLLQTFLLFNQTSSIPTRRLPSRTTQMYLGKEEVYNKEREKVSRHDLVRNNNSR